MNILMIGATSAIAKATARRYAEQGKTSFTLLARNEQALQDLAHDLLVRGAEAVNTRLADFADDSCVDVLEQALAAMNSVDIVLVAHGVLGEQTEFQQDVTALKAMLYTNSISTLSMLTLIANRLEQQQHGTLAFISSVAGDRGRASNYAYGASKAIVNTFLQGLRVRLSKVNVNVLTIKPGFVDTPMTAAFDKKGLLWAQPEDIAKGIEKAVAKRKGVVYLPWFWRIIMGIIVRIPDRIFNKLNL